MKQGNQPDCYLLSVLISLYFKHPEYAKSLIEKNCDNSYTVKFFNMGRRVNIQITNEDKITNFNQKKEEIKFSYPYTVELFERGLMKLLK